MMVTSALEEEGKSTTVANLAVSFARSGKRTTLVDLDLGGDLPFIVRGSQCRVNPYGGDAPAPSTARQWYVCGSRPVADA
jgi:CobQ/CobB/MinD/ParA nucleotide binding domain